MGKDKRDKTDPYGGLDPVLVELSDALSYKSFLEREPGMIYSRRFPPNNVEQALKDAEKHEPDIDAEAGWRRFQERLEEVRLRPDDPERVRRCEQMAKRAMELSEIYEIDMDVERGAWWLTVTMYLASAGYMDDLKDRFAELFSLCDDFSLFHIPQGGKDITLSLSCRSRAV